MLADEPLTDKLVELDLPGEVRPDHVHDDVADGQLVGVAHLLSSDLAIRVVQILGAGENVGQGSCN